MTTEQAKIITKWKRSLSNLLIQWVQELSFRNSLCLFWLQIVQIIQLIEQQLKLSRPSQVLTGLWQVLRLSVVLGTLSNKRTGHFCKRKARVQFKKLLDPFQCTYVHWNVLSLTPLKVSCYFQFCYWCIFINIIQIATTLFIHHHELSLTIGKNFKK